MTRQSSCSRKSKEEGPVVSSNCLAYPRTFRIDDPGLGAVRLSSSNQQRYVALPAEPRALVSSLPAPDRPTGRRCRRCLPRPSPPVTLRDATPTSIGAGTRHRSRDDIGGSRKRRQLTSHLDGPESHCIYYICMKQLSYGVREFQANLGAALRAAERGDRVVITSRGRAVAVLARPDADEPGDSPEERRLKRLAAEGKLRLAKRGPIPSYAPPHVSGLARQLEADRR